MDSHSIQQIMNRLSNDRFVEAESVEAFCESIAAEQISDDTDETIEQPNFDVDGRVHNWRRYVPTSLKQDWSELSCDQQCFVITQAHFAALSENRT